MIVSNTDEELGRKYLAGMFPEGMGNRVIAAMDILGIGYVSENAGRMIDDFRREDSSDDGYRILFRNHTQFQLDNLCN